MTTDQLSAFDDLRANWLRHDDLRRSGAELAELWASRANLDDARCRAHRKLDVASIARR